MSAARTSHPFSLCTASSPSSPHCLRSPAASLTEVSSESRTQAGLFQTFGKAMRTGLSEGWHLSCIFGAHCAFLRKDPNTEPALGVASLLPHGWLRWRLLPKDRDPRTRKALFTQTCKLPHDAKQQTDPVPTKVSGRAGDTQGPVLPDPVPSFSFPPFFKHVALRTLLWALKNSSLFLGPQPQLKELGVPVARQGGPSNCTFVTLPPCHLSKINRTSLPR